MKYRQKNRRCYRPKFRIGGHPEILRDRTKLQVCGMRMSSRQNPQTLLPYCIESASPTDRLLIIIIIIIITITIIIYIISCHVFSYVVCYLCISLMFTSCLSISGLVAVTLIIKNWVIIIIIIIIFISFI